MIFQSVKLVLLGLVSWMMLKFLCLCISMPALPYMLNPLTIFLENIDGVQLYMDKPVWFLEKTEKLG